MACTPLDADAAVLSVRWRTCGPDPAIQSAGSWAGQKDDASELKRAHVGARFNFYRSSLSTLKRLSAIADRRLERRYFFGANASFIALASNPCVIWPPL